MGEREREIVERSKCHNVIFYYFDRGNRLAQIKKNGLSFDCAALDSLALLTALKVTFIKSLLFIPLSCVIEARNAFYR